MSYSKNIQKYNFAEADFDSVSKKMFEMDKLKLSEMDRAILDAIKFQMKVSNANNVMQKLKQNIMNNELRIMNHASNVIYPMYHTPYPISRFAIASASFTVIAFLLVSLTYFANVNLHLGMNFLTELFA